MADRGAGPLFIELRRVEITYCGCGHAKLLAHDKSIEAPSVLLDRFVP